MFFQVPGGFSCTNKLQPTAWPAERTHCFPAASLALRLKPVHKDAVRCIARKSGQPFPDISDTIHWIRSRAMASGSEMCIWIAKTLASRFSRTFYLFLPLSRGHLVIGQTFVTSRMCPGIKRLTLCTTSYEHIASHVT